LFLKPDQELRAAAKHAVLSIGPVLAKMERPMIDPDRARAIDQAKASLIELAKALEAR